MLDGFSDDALFLQTATHTHAPDRLSTCSVGPAWPRPVQGAKQAEHGL